jgi:hypothetical protein
MCWDILAALEALDSVSLLNTCNIWVFLSFLIVYFVILHAMVQ